MEGSIIFHGDDPCNEAQDDNMTLRQGPSFSERMKKGTMLTIQVWKPLKN